MPPFRFEDIKGVIPQIQGFKINDALMLNEFKEKVEGLLGIQSRMNHSAWERKRDMIVERLNEKIEYAEGEPGIF